MKSPTKLIALALVAALVFAYCCSDKTSEEPPANVILITMDTTRADYLSSYGYHRETTPNMDRLASEGVKFTRAMSTSAVTPVSHASILTGLNQYEHGLRVMGAESGDRIAPETQSFATVLKKRGYETAAVHSAFPVSSIFGFDQDFDLFESLEAVPELVEVPVWDDVKQAPARDESGKPILRELEVWNAEATRNSKDTTERVLQFLDTAKEPFFLWIHYWDPHDANEAPPEEFMDRKYLIPTKGDKFVRTDDFYAEEVRYLDSQLGRLFEGLRERKLYDEALIILTADHGDGLSDGEKNHGWKAHRELYVEQLNVPLIYKFPSRTAGATPGTTIDQLVGTVDILPTACDYLNIGLTELVSGKSLRSLVEGGPTEPRVFYADQINGFDRNAAMVDKRPEAMFIYSVMNNDWKLIYRPTEPKPKELYHIASDPRELSNVAAANPEIVNELMLNLAGRGGWIIEDFRPGGLSGPDVNTAGIGYVASKGSYEGKFVWVCPIEHEHKANEPGTCPECDNPLVPYAAEPRE